jgi:hypothetical protein
MKKEVSLPYTWASSRAGPGWVKKKPETEMAAQARPSPIVGPENVNPGPARVSCFLWGRRVVGTGLPKIVRNCYPGQAQVSSRAMILRPRPAHRVKKCGPGLSFSGWAAHA